MPSSKKKILLFTPGPTGGAEKIVAKGAEALKAIGENIELWIIRESRVPHIAKDFLDMLPSNLEFRIFESRGILDFTLLKMLKKALKDETGLLHTHGFKALFYGYLARNFSLKLLHTHHGKTRHTLKVRFYEFLETILMKRSSGVIAVSQEMKEALVRSGILVKQIQVIENFLTINFQEKRPRTDKLRLLFVGRLSPEKGCDLLIRALKTFPSHNFDVSVLGDGTEKLALQELSRGMDINFLGFQKDVSFYLSQHDVLVMPSLREGQPLALIEAASFGLPVVASRVGGIPEIIEHDKNGYLFSPGDVLQLANALVKMKENYPTLKTKTESYAKDYQMRFSSESWAIKTKLIYQSVLTQE